MMTVDEMRIFLLEQFGIKTDEELDRALKKQGGIRIAVFVDPKEGKKTEALATA